jgi:hypothetical protein
VSVKGVVSSRGARKLTAHQAAMMETKKKDEHKGTKEGHTREVGEQWCMRIREKLRGA